MREPWHEVTRLIFGVITTKGTKPLYLDVGRHGLSFGFNIPKVFGLYFWFLVEVVPENTEWV